MGAEVRYCYKCQRRLLEADFGRGAALRVGSLSTCMDCAEELLNRLTPEQRRAILRKAEEGEAPAGAGPSSERTPRHLPSPRATTSLRGARPAGPARGGRPIAAIAAIAAGAVLLIALLLFGGRGAPSPPPPPEPPRRSAAPIPPPSPSPGASPAPAADEGAERKALIADIAALDRETSAMTDAEAFGQALARLATARSSRRDPEWETVIDRLEKRVRKTADEKYRALEIRAMETKRQGASVRGYRETVARWGIPAQVEALEKALQAVPPPVPAVGLALRLRFDETGGVEADDAAGGPPGRIRGVPAWETGRFGNALRFNGYDTYVHLDDRPSLNPEQAITIAAWVKASDWLGNYRICQKGVNDNQYRLTREREGMLFDIRDVGRVAASLPNDDWHHVAATYDGTTLKIYWDGSVAAQAAATGRIPRTPDPLCVGTKREGAPPGDYFIGLMDELLIYSRALTDAEVAALAARD